MIVRIYDGKSTPAQLLTNGIGALEAISCLVYEDLNGAYRCEVTIPTGSAWSNYFFFGAIVKVMTPRGEDYFRLDIPTVTLDTISAVGWQISNDLGMPKIVNVGITAKTGTQALGIILAASPDETRFSGTSDITTVQNMHMQLQSPLAALIDQSVSNCFVRRWGGEIWRNKFTVNINTRIGSDKGYRVALGKNLLGVTETPDGSGYANRIIPKGLSANDTPLYLPEVYIDSSVVNPYDNLKHTKFIDTGIKVGATDPVTGAVMYADDAAAYTAMRNMVALLYAAGADIPGVTATVSFVHLGDTDEYKAFAALENVELGDDVTCEYLGRSLKKRVVSYVFDGLSEKYISITLGSVARTITQEIFAQDISLAALSDSLTKTVKQNERYNDVYMNHDEGFVAESTFGGNAYKVAMNASEGISIYRGATKIFYIDSATGEIRMSDNSVKQGTTYSGTSISAAGGLACTATIDGHAISVTVSAAKPFELSIDGYPQIYVKNGVLVTSPCDINEDGIVDQTDLDIATSYILSADPTFRANLLAQYPKMDVNHSGTVTSSDLTLIARAASIYETIGTGNYKSGVDSGGFYTLFNGSKVYRYTP